MKDLPFTWNIRLSKRASRPRITISAYGKVELVCPARMAQKNAISMLVNHQDWVVKQLDKLVLSEKSSLALPHQIQLVAVGKTWQVKYIQETGSRLKVIEEDTNLYVHADLANPEAIRKALCDWLKGKGKWYLSAWLEEIAKMMVLSYESVTVRLQKKRWGSCSQAKRINLNAALLFLPKNLVEHVLIHELSHLKYLNHSPLFWAEVAKIDVSYADKRRQLRKQTSCVPAWVTESFAMQD